MKAISIKDLAKKAGVSISTASYALNGVPKVSKETRERILRIANDLNYKPNSFAKSLKTKKTHIIGLFVSHMDSPYYFEILQGIDEELEQFGYDFIVARILSPDSTGYSMIRDRRIDAAIILGGSYVPRPMLSEIVNSGIPISVTDCDMDEELEAAPSLQYAAVDNDRGFRLVLEHLWKRGIRDLAFMGGTEASYDARSRKKVFTAFCSEKGVSLPPEWIMCGNYREDHAFSVIKDLVASGTRLPQAVCCANDQMAIGVVGALKTLGIAVPERVAVTGFDNIRQSAFCAPALTTVDRGDLEMGRKLARGLVAALNGGPLEKRVSFEVKLVERDSCGKSRPQGD